MQLKNLEYDQKRTDRRTMCYLLSRSGLHEQSVQTRQKIAQTCGFIRLTPFTDTAQGSAYNFESYISDSIGLDVV